MGAKEITLNGLSQKNENVLNATAVVPRMATLLPAILLFWTLVIFIPNHNQLRFKASELSASPGAKSIWRVKALPGTPGVTNPNEVWNPRDSRLARYQMTPGHIFPSGTRLGRAGCRVASWLLGATALNAPRPLLIANKIA